MKDEGKGETGYGLGPQHPCTPNTQAGNGSTGVNTLNNMLNRGSEGVRKICEQTLFIFRKYPHLRG